MVRLHLRRPMCSLATSGKTPRARHGGATTKLQATGLNSRSSSLLWLALLGCLWAITVVAMVTSESLLRGMLTSATAAAIIAPALIRIGNGSFDLFEPLAITLPVLLIMFVARPIADQVISSYNHTGYDISSTFDITLVTVLIGCTALSAGYLWRSRWLSHHTLPRPSEMFPNRKVKIAALAIAALGLSLFGIFLRSKGGIGIIAIFMAGRSTQKFALERNSTGYLYDSMFFLVPAAFTMFAAWLRWRRLHMLMLSMFIGLPFVAYEAAQGDRNQLLTVIFGVPLIYYLVQQRRPRMHYLLLSGVGLLLVLVFIREFRDSDSAIRSGFDASDFAQHPAETIGKSFTQQDDEMFDTLANIISVVPSRIPYQPEAVLTDIGTRAIPRSVYPDKPLEANDQFVSFMWPLHYRAVRASAASSIFGNFYLYGGVLGVAIGSFVIGTLLRQTWNWVKASGSNINAILIYSFVPSLIVMLLRGTVSETLTRVFFMVLPIMLAQRYWGRARSVGIGARFQPGMRTPSLLWRSGPPMLVAKDI
jgi:oligosaccharide repeat unit polymerase